MSREQWSQKHRTPLLSINEDDSLCRNSQWWPKSARTKKFEVIRKSTTLREPEKVKSFVLLVQLHTVESAINVERAADITSCSRRPHGILSHGHELAARPLRSKSQELENESRILTGS